MRNRNVLLALAFLMPACGGGVIQRVDYATPKRDTGVLLIAITPPNGSIYIDGKYSGEVARYAAGRIPVPVGQRRISIHRSGYYTWYKNLKVEPREYPFTIKLVATIQNNPNLDPGNGIKSGLE